MSTRQASLLTPGVTAALAELQALIRAKYPTAEFETTHGDDPEGIYLTATVDVDDTDPVFDVVADRLLTLQVDEGLPIYVVPVRPLSRILARREALANQAANS